MKFFSAALLLSLFISCENKPAADIILFNGKIVTVDSQFSIAAAIAVKDGKISGVGSNEQVLKFKGDSTQVIDLKGGTVIPGLIDAHAHPIGASQSELNETIPDVHTIHELLTWIAEQTKIKKAGEWIIHPKFFITRMLDMRQMTLKELDSVSPNNPVLLDGSWGGMVNSKALKVSNLWDSKNPGILRSEKTGQPLGLIHSTIFSLLATPPERKLTEEEEIDALRKMLHDYNKIGLTSIYSGGGAPAEYDLFEKLMKRNELTVRVFHNFIFPFRKGFTDEQVNKILTDIGKKTGDGNEMLKVGAWKVVLDGGVLTGTAYLRSPWGAKAKKVYGISDTTYRGNLFYSEDELRRLVRMAVQRGWKFTAHVTGGGGVDTLLAAYEKINDSTSIKERRFSVIHGNFYTPEAIEKMAAMGIYADMQPPWYMKDADLLSEVLGREILSTFHPYRSILDKHVVLNAGSDHMVKMDPNTSVNPYNPFLGMWTAVTRKTERGSTYNPEQAITREEALRMYTINNAKGSFEENIKGSLEHGKLADLVVLSSDILTCPADSIKTLHPTMTMVNGKVVYEER